MLVELSVMEQRYQAVLAVIQDGWKVVEVADRLGVSRQAIGDPLVSLGESLAWLFSLHGCGPRFGGAPTPGESRCPAGHGALRSRSPS